MSNKRKASDYGASAIQPGLIESSEMTVQLLGAGQEVSHSKNTFAFIEMRTILVS